MGVYHEIESISALPQFGNTGPNGWGFHLWSEHSGDDAPHRALLEKFAAEYPQTGMTLPTYNQDEDFVECYAAWDSKTVWVYYETILSYLWLWSADRDAINAVRSALIPLIAA
jgi:hypothetical protein